MTKIQLKRSSALLSGSARVPGTSQLDYGEIAINYNSSDPQIFYKDSGGNVVSFFEPYAPLAGATFTGDVNFDGELIIKGDSTNGSGKITLNCESNDHGVKIKGPAHSASANYTLTLPTSAGSSGEVLSTDGSGGLSWAYAAMSTADKNKLDGIETGATADQTGAEIKTLYQAQPSAFTDVLYTKLSNIENNAKDDQTPAEILGALELVDGSGSGLDADKVDGIHASSFLRSDALDVFNAAYLEFGGSAVTSAEGGEIRLTSPSGQSHGNTVIDMNGVNLRFFYANSPHKGAYLPLSSLANSVGSRILTTSDEGSGNGLDADTLDGVQLTKIVADKTTQIGTSSSWDITEPGMYGVASSSAFTGTNAPSGVYTYGHLLVTEHQGEGMAQIYFPHTGSGSSKIMVRTGWNGGSWQGWATLWTSNCDGAGSGLDADHLDGYGWTTQGKNVRANEFYADNWFRNYNDGEGLYNESTGVHWHSDGDGYWCARDSSSHIGIKLKTNGSTQRGMVYANSSDQIGFLDRDGQWAIRHTRDNRTEFFINNTEYAEINTDYFTHTSDVRTPIFYDSNNTNYYLDPASHSNLNTARFQGNAVYIRGSSPTLYLQDTNHNVAMMHCNSDLLYVLRGSDDSTTWTQVSNQWPFIFYLSNNNAKCGGSFEAVGNVTAYSSDRRLKTNFNPITAALDKVKSLTGLYFDWKEEVNELGFSPDQMTNDIGLIAQDVQAVLPQAVKPAPFDQVWDEKISQNVSASGKDYITVQYERLVPLLVEAIKELSEKVIRLEQEAS